MKEKSVSVSVKDLKAMMFWASYGLAKASAGSYVHRAIKAIPLYAKKFKRPELWMKNPQLGKYL